VAGCESSLNNSVSAQNDHTKLHQFFSPLSARKSYTPSQHLGGSIDIPIVGVALLDWYCPMSAVNSARIHAEQGDAELNPGQLLRSEDNQDADASNANLEKGLPELNEVQMKHRNTIAQWHTGIADEHKGESTETTPASKPKGGTDAAVPGLVLGGVASGGVSPKMAPKSSAKMSGQRGDVKMGDVPTVTPFKPSHDGPVQGQDLVELMHHNAYLEKQIAQQSMQLEAYFRFISTVALIGRKALVVTTVEVKAPDTTGVENLRGPALQEKKQELTDIEEDLREELVRVGIMCKFFEAAVSGKADLPKPSPEVFQWFRSKPEFKRKASMIKQQDISMKNGGAATGSRLSINHRLPRLSLFAAPSPKKKKRKSSKPKQASMNKFRFTENDVLSSTANV
jgi:hypothetical protein